MAFLTSLAVPSLDIGFTPRPTLSGNLILSVPKSSFKILTSFLDSSEPA